MSKENREETVLELTTEWGPALARLSPAPRGAVSTLYLGHGAGGDVDAPDLVAITELAARSGVSVVRVTQPYRVAGRRAPAPAPRLDTAWLQVSAQVSARRGYGGRPVVFAGRSSGARVACRTSRLADVAAVIALAFPVHPPGKPEKSRLDELEAVTVPTLVVQGSRDAFGQPPAPDSTTPLRQQVVIPGADHSLKRDPVAVARAVIDFLVALELARPLI